MIIAAFALLLALSSPAAAQQDEEQSLQCEIGGIAMQLGGNDWIAYGCDDSRSFVILSTANNPATPFYFIIAWNKDRYRIVGEGNGDKTASAAAFEELKSMSQTDLAGLNAKIRQSDSVSGTS